MTRSRLVGVEGGSLGQLWAVYERGQFPRPPLDAGRDAEPTTATDLAEM